jgi:hypothetical protein
MAILKSAMRVAPILVLLLTMAMQSARAQISPGKLSKAHQDLEGVTNCSQCHESGSEISGSKCLTCHAEIKMQIDVKRGFHFENSRGSCITCHKEHLGRDSKITRFEETQFDHAKSGFPLTGKHASIKCEECHAEKNIRSSEVRKGLSVFPHKTFLGLDQRCISCHVDRHRGLVSADCQSCHSANAWAISTFDHSKTKFALAGKHATVECVKCHDGARKKGPTDPILFGAKSYSDCTPCHLSPHGPKLADKTCRSCHGVEGWTIVKSFNHSRTQFPLSGKHQNVPCVKCHTQMETKKGPAVNLATKEFRDCQPCHRSPHGPALSSQQCRSCHETATWSMRAPTTFNHSLTRFALDGKHSRVKCETCHVATGISTFATRYLLAFSKCSDCHSDYHKGQFVLNYGNDCAICHTVRGFKPSTFALDKHSAAKFPLTGSHAAVLCVACHTARNDTARADVQYTGISLDCESCHQEIHGGQFAISGKTSCVPCHSATGWRSLVFNHEVQSSFQLTGAHKGVPCSSCHKEEYFGGKKLVRYKPLASRCESCHRGVK